MRKLLAQHAEHLSYLEAIEVGRPPERMQFHDLAELWSGGCENHFGRFRALCAALGRARDDGALAVTEDEKGRLWITRRDLKAWLEGIGEELPEFWFPGAKAIADGGKASTRIENNHARMLGALAREAGYLTGDLSKDVAAFSALLDSYGVALDKRTIRKGLELAAQLVPAR